MGYEGYNMDCRPDLKEKKLSQQKERQKKANALTKAGRSLRLLAVTDEKVREGGKKVETKSQLLKQADKVFGDWIKNRDKENFIDEETGDVIEMIKCPCCYKWFNLEEKTSGGDKVVNVLHFVDRNIYSLRFDEDNSHSGCCYCNLDQHLNPKGKTYKNYREFMVEKFGEVAVAEMEVAHRKINKITEQQLRTVIEHYSNQPLNT